jgi:hypothetical protein
MPTAKCFFCSVDADVKSLKKCGACGSVISGTTRTSPQSLICIYNDEQRGHVLREFHFSATCLAGDQDAVIVEGMSEAVVEGDTQVYVLAYG